MPALSPAETRRLRILDLASRRVDDPQDVVTLAERMERFVAAGPDLDAARAELLEAATDVVAAAHGTSVRPTLGDAVDRLARARTAVLALEAR